MDIKQTHFYMNFHLKDVLRMAFEMMTIDEMMQEGALILFALYDQYRRNAAQEQ